MDDTGGSWPANEDDLRAAYRKHVAESGRNRAVTAMASAYGMDSRTVRKRLVAAGLRSKTRAQCPPPERLTRDYERVVAEAGERAAVSELMRTYGASDHAVRMWLDKTGLRPTGERSAPARPITEPCPGTEGHPCGAVATTRYKGEDPAYCFRCYMRVYAADKTSAARRKAREYIYGIKRKSICVDCAAEGRDGKWPIAVLHFDHVPERGPKLFNIGNGDYAIKTVETEIAKCDVVCANHHAIRTWTGRGEPLGEP